MNWHSTLKSIYAELQASGYSELANDIHESQLSGGTGGEIFDRVVSKLIEIKNNQPKAYLVIKGEVDVFIAYGRSIGYLSKPE